MGSWLQDLGAAETVDMRVLVLRLTLAAVAGLIVAGVYRGTQRRVGSASLSLITTLLLLTILVAMTTIVIGDNVARAFGLVGALSIVRFRTVVDDTRDTSFVIFAVVVGMAIGAGYLAVCIVGMPIVAAAALGMRGIRGEARGDSLERTLQVRISAGHDPESFLIANFRDQLGQWRLLSIVTARQGAAYDLVYLVRLRDDQSILPLVKAINAIDGVQSVELKAE